MAPSNVGFQTLHGVMLHGTDPALNTLYGVIGVQVPATYPSFWTYALLGVGLLTLLTFGVSSAAMTYIHRNFIRREPVDLAEDYFHCIKRNFKQALLLGFVAIGGKKWDEGDNQKEGYKTYRERKAEEQQSNSQDENK
jgi:uncharacterized membrane protein YesL